MNGFSRVSLMGWGVAVRRPFATALFKLKMNRQTLRASKLRNIAAALFYSHSCIRFIASLSKYIMK